MVLNRQKTLNIEAVQQFYYRRIKRIVPLYALVIFLILIFLRFCLPETNFDSNVSSAWSAMMFATNLRGEDPNMAYAAKLELAEDAFTHSWSLAVEMQFYLLVPGFFYLLKKSSTTMRSFLIGATAFASCLFQLTTENEYTSFNNVFCRLWQFSIGIYSFFVTESEPSIDVETAALLPANNDLATENHGLHSSENPIIYSMIQYCTAIAVILPFSPHKLPEPYLRIVVTVLSGGIMICGWKVQSKLVSNTVICYLGDISYALYLVHWPIFTYIKLQFSHNITALCCGCLLSCLLGAFLKETYEKWYLKLSKSEIVFLIIALYTLCLAFLAICIQVDKLRYFPAYISSDGKLSNWTTDEIIQLNKDFTRNDSRTLVLSQCKYRKDNGPWGWCDFKNETLNGTRSIIIIGNSYAPNIAPVIYESCGGKSKQMQLLTESCDFLLMVPEGKCAKIYRMVVETLRNSNPDVLFIMTRYSLDRMDKNLADIQERLHDLADAVKYRTYILDAMPTTNRRITDILNTQLLRGKLPTQAFLQGPDDFQPARDVLAKVVATCAKCHLVDYMPALTINGTYSQYDETNGLSFFTNGMHITRHGLARIKPLFNDICASL